MANLSNNSSDSETSPEEKFYRMLEDYTQQVRLRYAMSIRPNLPRIRKKSEKSILELK
ncbi:hypothetical protein GCM10028806_42370 [Spirosoma terrae]|uniref:Uncharacterized protein n=1 Tax=Spirosoma terrae TaxID=1968276 RepID=A0A6L9L3V4_9BACT|nr:hypothetical protein [Spirosoma terrae]NDU94097.1 hypothetical protein [Spirosoma terrae]